MKVFKTIADWRAELKSLNGSSVGFVPTMGALHRGHLSLVERAKKENDVVLLSIFVNPTQFNDSNDFDKYPRVLETDLALLQEAKVNYVFCPEVKEIYPTENFYKVIELKDSQILEGAFRPGHFEGMLGVVMKLLHISGADRVYFGEKDFQQLELVKGMIREFFLKVELRECPTLREVDGLALSSRNLRLNPEARKKAPEIYKTLISSPSCEFAKELLTSKGFKVDYVSEWRGRRLVAAYLDGVRLIDNVAIEELKK